MADTPNIMFSVSTCGWTEELEILTSIYPEISIQAKSPNECVVSFTIYPATADDKESRHVMLTLDFTLGSSYPDTAPLINFHNHRGLSDVKLSELHDTLTKKSEKLLGSSMLYQLRGFVQDFLTVNNRPSPEIECPICLSTLKEADQFYRTACYHYFHPNCLGEHLKSLVKNFDRHGFGRMSIRVPPVELTCPACRHILNEEFPGGRDDIDKLLNASPPEADEELEEFGNPKMVQEMILGESVSVPVATVTIPPSWLEQREAHKALLEKQKAQGGTVDADPFTRFYHFETVRLSNHGHNPFPLIGNNFSVASPSETMNSHSYRISRLQDEPSEHELGDPNNSSFSLAPPSQPQPRNPPNAGPQEDRRYSRPNFPSFGRQMPWNLLMNRGRGLLLPRLPRHGTINSSEPSFGRRSLSAEPQLRSGPRISEVVPIIPGSQ